MEIGYQESRTTGSNPDIIIKHKFQIAHKSYFKYTVDHNGKDKHVTNVNNDHDVAAEKYATENGTGKGTYDTYLEYAGRSNVTALEDGVSGELLPTFTQDKLNITKEDGKLIEQHLGQAEENQTMMWKTVVSFSDEFLIEQGLMDNADDRNLDQQAIKKVIQDAMPDMLAAEGLSDTAEWFGAIHLYGDNNKRHIHVHLAIFEPGQSARPDKFNPKTFKIEPKGTFKQKTLRSFKSKVWRGMLHDSNQQLEKELFMQRTQFKTDVIDEWHNRQLEITKTARLNTLIRLLPTNQSEWRAKSNSAEMRTANRLAREFVELTLANDGADALIKYDDVNDKLSELYKTGFGENDSVENYSQKNHDVLINQLINALYDDLKSYDPEQMEDSLKSIIADSDPEENIQIKKVLQESVDDMKDKGIEVPSRIKRELGIRKNVIRQQNLEIQEMTLSRRLDDIAKFLEDNDSPLLNRIQTDSVRELALNSYLQIPTFKRSADDKLSVEYLQSESVDIHQAPINTFIKINADYWQRQRQELLDLIESASDEELQIGFGSTDFRVVRSEVIESIQKEIQVINLKANIYENNQLIENDTLTDDEQRDIKLKNAELFGRIAEIEGRENSFEKNKALQDKKLFSGIIKERATQKFSGKRFAEKQTRFFSRNLVYQLGAINHNREMALNAYEMDQALQREAIFMENAEFD